MCGYEDYERLKRTVYEDKCSNINLKTIASCGQGLHVIQMFAISKNILQTGADAAMNVTAGSGGILPTVDYWNKVQNNENI